MERKQETYHMCFYMFQSLCYLMGEVQFIVTFLRSWSPFRTLLLLSLGPFIQQLEGCESESPINYRRTLESLFLSILAGTGWCYAAWSTLWPNRHLKNINSVQYWTLKDKTGNYLQPCLLSNSGALCVLLAEVELVPVSTLGSNNRIRDSLMQYYPFQALDQGS